MAVGIVPRPLQPPQSSTLQYQYPAQDPAYVADQAAQAAAQPGAVTDRKSVV